MKICTGRTPCKWKKHALSETICDQDWRSLMLLSLHLCTSVENVVYLKTIVTVCHLIYQHNGDQSYSVFCVSHHRYRLHLT